MKTLSLTLLFAVLLCFTVTGGEYTKKSWTLIHKEAGIEFYTTSILNHVDQHSKSLLKIKNTNAYETRLQFATIIPCAENQDIKENENVFIGASSMAMFTYQHCDENDQAALQISQVSISK